MTTDKSFEEIFEELARHNDRSVIWNDWLDYAIEVNLLTTEPHEFQKNYHGNEQSYHEMIVAWINELSQELENKPYYDILGKFYEELIQSRSKASSLGQAYTPPSVTNLLSELVFDETKKYDDLIANDPAGGSGRTLLAAHVKSKGEVFCISGDIDETSCRMCVLNFFSHGVRGSVLQQDALTGEFYKGWRINKYLYHGIPQPHIELINNPDEAYDFIELNNNQTKDNTPVTTNNTDDNDDDGGASETVKPIKEFVKTGGQIQSTLI